MAAAGSRWMKNSNVVVRQPLLRVVLGRLYHYFTMLFLGIKIKDTQCGLKVYKREVVGEVLKKITTSNLSFDTAFLYHAQKTGYNVAEIPITWKDMDGSKVSPFKTAFIMFITLIGIRLAHSRFSRKILQLIEINYKSFGYI